MLCECVKTGDSTAVETLIHRYLPMIRGQASAYRGGRVEVEDLMQEGLMGFFRAIKSYDPGRSASFKTFAYTCSNNRMLSALISAKPPMEAGVLSPAELGDPQQVLIEQEQYTSLLGNIQDLLSDMENQTLRLFLSGVSYDEIARELGMSHKAVDNALQRVRRKLKAVL